MDKSLLEQLVPWTIIPWTIVATPDETVSLAGGGIPGDSVQPDMQAAEERIDSQTRSPIRPQRTRRPNVRYN